MMLGKAWRHTAPQIGPALDARGRDVFLAQLVDHETARHARDIGQRIIAEDAGGQDQVAEGIAKDRPLAVDGRVDQDDAGARA